VAITDAELSATKFPFTILGHVADGNFHSAIMTNPDDPNELLEVQALVHKITAKIIAMGGTCTGEHGIGAGKIEDLVLETGEGAVNVMRLIKKALDPNSILNPGKIFTL